MNEANSSSKDTRTSDTSCLSKDRLDQVVEAIKHALSDPELRSLSQRAVQGRVWHEQPLLAAVLSELRADEEAIRREILQRTSSLVYYFHEGALNATLARAGLVSDPRIHAGSSLDHSNKDNHHSHDMFSLDAKERLYMILQNYEWMQDFFRLYPLHFYENSFSFVDNIPKKQLHVKVKVIGLGIGGSVCVSGLAKHGITNVQGFEKRPESGPSSVASRYQNASWRAYDVAGKLVDEAALQNLLENRQQINVTYDDGTTGVVTSDRVQIILGSAIQSTVESARRYGAQLHFGEQENLNEYYVKKDNAAASDDDDDDTYDIVGLFCGAHTSEIFDGLKDQMHVMSWSPELDSTCKMWLRIQPSDKTEPYCTRGGELGAEKWHYTIESARQDVRDMERVRFNQDSWYKNSVKKLERGVDIGMTRQQVDDKYQTQKDRLEAVMKAVKGSKDENSNKKRFDYIFTNAPDNEHNQAKRQKEDDQVVLDGSYTVQVGMAANSVIDSGPLLDKFQTKLLICGGDACVPPNPLAAYGATLACEAAGSFVRLAVAIGHLNGILAANKSMMEKQQQQQQVDDEKKNNAAKEAEWITTQVSDLKSLLSQHYQARSRSENYFQWVQTLICNMYSLPAFYPPKE